MSQSASPIDDVTLTCTPERIDDRLVFTYEVTNRGAQDVYVMDAVVGIDPASRMPKLEPDNVTIWHGADGFAHLLKGLAPLPTDRNVAVRVIPVAVLLGPRSQMTRRLELSMPMAEQSPYFALGNLRDYRVAAIEGVALHVDVLRSTAAGFRAEPVAVSPEHFRAMSTALVTDLRRLVVSFRAKGLHLMVRTDAYPRPD